MPLGHARGEIATRRRVIGIDFHTGAPIGTTGFETWIHGHPAGTVVTEPHIQVQQNDEHTFVLRQSKAVHYEAPFLYLLFGQDRALLLDTGATSDPGSFPLRAVVDDLVSTWCTAHGIGTYELIVAHSHSHHDHIAADGQFEGRSDTRIQGFEVSQVAGFYGFGDDIDETVTFDLGGRRLEILRIPGHDAASIAVFDPWTGWVLTGDTVYPGRLYVRDAPAFRRSIANLVTLARKHDATAIMGCHVEMSTEAGQDYPRGSEWQPDEAPLPMTVAQLEDVDHVAYRCEQHGRYVFDDFILVSIPED